MKKYPLFVIFFSICLSFVTSAKEKADSLAEIYGNVRGTYSVFGYGSYEVEDYLSNVNVMLTFQNGSKRDTAYTMTDRRGVFIFKKIEPQTIGLTLSHVGKKTITGKYTIEAGRNAFYFTMENAPEKIEEASVTAEVPLMKKIADTTVYNTAAITTMDDESLRAVLEQLPGFKVDKDEIRVDGEPVKRTYINGVLIFGDNPVTAIDALRADEVTQVKVYDELSAVDRRRGRKHARKEKVLDVVTKEHLLALSEAGVTLSGGADETGQLRYSGVGAAAYHSEMLQLSGSVYAENSTPYFYSGGATMISNDISAVRNALSLGSTFDRLSDYSETYGAGVSAVKYWKDRNYGNSARVDYEYWHQYGKSASTVLRDYFANGTNPAGSSSDTTYASRVSGRHSVAADFNLNDTPLKSINLTLWGNFGDARKSSLDASKTVTQGVETPFSRHETQTSDSQDYEVHTRLGWTNNDAVKLRPSFSASFDISNSNSLSWTVDTLATSFDRRQLSSDGFGRSMRASANLVFENYILNDDKRTLSMTYGLWSTYNRNKSKQLTVDNFGVEIPVEDLANTYDYTWNDFTNAVGAGVRYSTRGLSMDFDFNLNNTIQKDDEFYPETYSSDRNYWGISSNFSLMYKRFLAKASVSSSVPSVEQTRNRISDTNPLALMGGNPNLKSAYNSNLNLIYAATLAKGMGNIMASFSADAGFRNIVSKTRYFSENTVLSDWDGYEAMAGSRLYTYENATTPSFRMNLGISATGLFFKRKLNVQFVPGAVWSSAPVYYGENLLSTNEIQGNGRLNLNYRVTKNLSFGAGTALGYSKSSDRTSGLLSERLSVSASADMRWLIAKGLGFNASYRFQNIDFLRGVGTDYFDHNLSASISYSFFKRTMQVSIEGINLLDTGTSFTNSVTAESSVQTWKPIYGRYLMVSFKYFFRNKSIADSGSSGIVVM